MTFRALLVTTDDQAVEVLASVLQNFGLRAQCASYSEAACLVTEQNFQAVLVDFDDPHSASQVLRNISSVAENHPVTVALLRDKTKVRNAFGIGAKFVLYKPISSQRAEDTLRAATALIKRDRRDSFRVPTQGRVRLRLKNGDEPREIQGILLDLSDSGMDVLAERPLHSGAGLDAGFTLPGSASEFEALGEVAWANPNGECGVRFTAIPENMRLELRDWLREHSQPASADDAEGIADCKLTDLSVGGCYIETASPFPERTHVLLTLRAEGVELQTAGRVRVMHPSHGMGIEFAGEDASQPSIQKEDFIEFLTSLPGIDPKLVVSPLAAEPLSAAFDGNNCHEDPLLDLLRNHESFSEEAFLTTLRKQRNAEFVQD